MCVCVFIFVMCVYFYRFTVLLRRTVNVIKYVIKCVAYPIYFILQVMNSKITTNKEFLLCGVYCRYIKVIVNKNALV